MGGKARAGVTYRRLLAKTIRNKAEILDKYFIEFSTVETMIFLPGQGQGSWLRLPDLACGSDYGIWYWTVHV
jgi:hypothetical protein